MSKQHQPKPLDLSSESRDDAAGRIAREKQALGIVSGHKMRQRNRNEPMGIKTTMLKVQQMRRLQTRMSNATITVVIEAALDALEQKLDRGEKP